MNKAPPRRGQSLWARTHPADGRIAAQGLCRFAAGAIAIFRVVFQNEKPRRSGAQGSDCITGCSAIWPGAHGFESNQELCRGYRPACERALRISGRRNSELHRSSQAARGAWSSQVGPPGAPWKGYPLSAMPTVHTQKLKRVLPRPRSNQVMSFAFRVSSSCTAQRRSDEKVASDDASGPREHAG
jgi:hypothetical protein